MDKLMLLVFLGTSIWVLIDAKNIGVRKGLMLISGTTIMGPWAWFFICITFWFVGFPMYLIKRGELKQAAATQAWSNSVRRDR